MSHHVSGLHRMLFAVGVVLALSFGASQAFASSASSAVCDEWPEQQGTCTTQAICNQRCADAGFGPFSNPCWQGCCLCTA